MIKKILLPIIIILLLTGCSGVKENGLSNPNSTGVNTQTVEIKQFSEIGNGLAKNINQLNKEPGITLTGFASDQNKKLFKVGIGIDHSKMTSEHLKLVVESYLNKAASYTSLHDSKILLKPYNLQIEEIDKKKNSTSLIAEKPSGSTDIIWKQ